MKKLIAYTEKNYFIFCTALYLIMAIVLFPHYKYFVDPDGESYTNIAVKYANGNFKDAINGFWSPMISWCIVPFLLVGLNKIIAAKVASVLIGFLSVFTFNILSNFSIKNKRLKIAVTFTATGLLLLYSLFDIAVDICLLAGLFFYFFLIFKDEYLQNVKQAILLGVAAAFCYFSKYYFFPFFLLHFLVCIVFFHKNNDWKIKNAAVVFISFFIFALPWIFFISQKYQIGLIYCTSGKIDISLELNNWVRNINSSQHFFLFPSNSSATDFTEDVFYVQGKYVSFFDSKSTILFEINHIKESLVAFWEIINQFSVFVFTLLLITAITVFQKTNDTHQKKNLKIFLLSMPVYCSGYWLMHGEYRYYFILNFLTIIFGCVFIEQWILNNGFSRVFKIGLVSFFLISFYLFPITLALQLNNREKYVHEISMRLKNDFKLKGIVLGEGGNYDDTQYACFATDLQNVIINPVHWNERERLKNELQKNNINYYFYWHWKTDQSDSLKSFYNFKEITEGKIYGLQIFKITPP